MAAAKHDKKLEAEASLLKLKKMRSQGQNSVITLDLLNYHHPTQPNDVCLNVIKIFCYISFLKEILNQIIQKNVELRGQSKSLYRNSAGRHFYGTENEIWAGFGPVGNTEKKI